MKQTKAGKQAQLLCKKFPKASTRALARMLYDMMPENFSNFESARSSIRIYRGTN